MTNTYEDNVPIEQKDWEERRPIRCLLERLLRVFDESMFVDYQFEKFSGKFKRNAARCCCGLTHEECDAEIKIAHQKNKPVGAE